MEAKGATMDDEVKCAWKGNCHDEHPPRCWVCENNEGTPRSHFIYAGKPLLPVCPILEDMKRSNK